MNADTSQFRVPATRAASINNYVRALHSIGAPVSRVLAGTGISSDILESEDAIIPLERAFKFGELACHAVGTEHLPLVIGLPKTLEQYGSYGSLIQEARTVYEYLSNGVRLYGMLISGQRLWLSRHGDQYRLNLATVGEPGLGSYQTHLQSLITTIAVLRRSLGQSWTPAEISFAYKSREKLPDSDLLNDSIIIRGAGLSYISISKHEMTTAFRCEQAVTLHSPPMSVSGAIPEDFLGLVRVQIESLLPIGKHHIDFVADSMMMSRRSLQRRLVENQQSYSRLLAETRLDIASARLATSDQPISEIAAELGYQDASNFSRAFRRKTGVSPRHYRISTKKTFHA